MPQGLSLGLIHRGSPPATPRSREPQLAVLWEPRRKNFASSVRAMVRGPKAPREFVDAPYFRNSWVRSSWPKRALVASALWHIVFVVFPFPTWRSATRPAQLRLPQIEVTWYAPLGDLPLIQPRDPVRALKPDSASSALLQPRRGADALHPRQTILSAPLAPTHPRQTLIQPGTPLEPPKILPHLPNIVRWTDSRQPARPRLQISQEALAKLRPKAPVVRPLSEHPAPEVRRQPAELNIAVNAMKVPNPQLRIAAGSVPRGNPHVEQDAGLAPDIQASVGNGVTFERLIALSATPGPAAANLLVPQGNLAARFSISPDGAQTGAPTGSANGTPGAGPQVSPGNGSGPPGISISGGNPNTTSSISGPAGPAISSPTSPRRALISKPEPRPAPLGPARAAPSTGLGRVQPGAAPETIFGPRRIYTVHVNMPNLASVTGSWILSFVEVHSSDTPNEAARAGLLSGPVALRKVDPRYPPELVTARVEGEVVLYAIIRKDGSVDSIQVVRGLDPQLDNNAMEALARWRFRPAERQGTPVELEAIVRIPFRAIAPSF